MPFVKRHEDITKKIGPYSNLRLWLNTFVVSFFVFASGSFYLFARRGNYDLYIANKVLATTAFVLVGLSLALSGLCYFWDFVDTKIIYRKHLGLVGFAYAIVHIIVATFFLPNNFPFPEWIYENWNSVIYAIFALVIFSGMAAISNRYAAHALGGKRWRSFLRVGYLGFIFVIIHFAFLKYEGWIKWFDTKEPLLPPLSLLELIFGLAVVVLRIALWIALKRAKKQEFQSEA